MTPLYLASASPRRKALLQQIGLDCTIFSVDLDESLLDSESANAAAQRLALTKAQVGWHHQQRQQDWPVLAADTLVVCEQAIMGKPQSQDEAVAMLLHLSNKTHQVLTAVACVHDSKQRVLLVASDVTFAEITLAQAQAYWQSGEPKDKAGGYAIQGKAAMWVKHIDGSYSGIMGLPLYETHQLLTEFGIRL